MGFASPWALLAIGAVAIPIAVHLVAREPRGGAPFPSLMFVSRIPVRVRRQRTLRDRSLLALRCLAIALLALAFAGPYADSPREPLASASGQALAVVVDRSASMGYTGRWDAARSAARAALDRLAPGDTGALVLFDTRHSLVAADADTLRSALQAAQPGDGATDLAAALEAGARWLGETRAATRTLVLVSDLQRTGLDAARGVRMGSGIALEIVPVGDAAAGNAALIHAAARPGAAGSRMRIETAVRLAGGAAPREVTLSLDGLEMERRAVPAAREAEIQAQDQTWASSVRIARVAFEIAAPVSRSAVVRLSLPPDALGADDARELVLAPVRALRVLIAGEGSRPSVSGEYLARALEVAEEPPVTLRYRAVAALDAATFDEADVIVLDDLPLAGDWLPAIAARVAAGAGLLVVAGDGVRGAWPGGPDGILPGTLGPAREPTSRPARLAARGDLPAGLESAGVWRYRELDAAAGDHVLIALVDGAPLALERPVGAGRTVALATTLAPRWSNLAREPGFVPLVHELVARLAARGEPAPPAYAVGTAIDLAEHARSLDPAAAARLDAGGEPTVRGPSGDETRLGARTPLVLREAGVHEVYVGPHAMRLAAHLEPKESDLDALEAGALEAQVVRIDAVGPGPADVGEDPRAGQGETWWWRILLAATILLLVESWLANRISRLAPERGAGRVPDQPAGRTSGTGSGPQGRAPRTPVDRKGGPAVDQPARAV